MKLAVIKYNAGNVQSVLFALQRLGVQAEVTDDVEKIRGADKVIFPGVGNAGAAMQSLRDKGLDEVIRSLTQPLLGICVGMQLLCDHSEESDTACLGIIPLQVKKFRPQPGEGKVPQMGWNTISGLSSSLFSDVEEGSFVYYVHSYYVTKGENTIATTHYLHDYSAAIKKDNFYGVQFHTEKSATVGDQILKNFLKL
jgi:glutamine amidotransferase